jgi:hypothetical protein
MPGLSAADGIRQGTKRGLLALTGEAGERIAAVGVASAVGERNAGLPGLRARVRGIAEA